MICFYWQGVVLHIWNQLCRLIKYIYICRCSDALEGLLGHEERAYINLSCSWCRYKVYFSHCLGWIALIYIILSYNDLNWFTVLAFLSSWVGSSFHLETTILLKMFLRISVWLCDITRLFGSLEFLVDSPVRLIWWNQSAVSSFPAFPRIIDIDKV